MTTPDGNGNGNSFERKLTWLLGVLALFLAAWFGIEQRIEAASREAADARKDLETRIEKSLDEIKGELRELNRYLRRSE